MSQLHNAYALIIGIEYDFDDLDTTGDAEDIAAVLKDKRLCGYPAANVMLLTKKQANRNGILEAFDDLISRTDENSSVFLYYSGHGDVYNDIFHFVPAGITGGMTAEEYMEEWVTADEIKEKIGLLKTRRLIFFLDCCHSTGIAKADYQTAGEGVGQTIEESTSEFSKADGLAQKVDTEQGISIVASCKEDQKSYQLGNDKNSIFTKHLLMALKGMHKEHFTDPYIRILEVAAYLLKVIPPLIVEAGQAEEPPLDIKQEPYVNLELYDDFILSYVPLKFRPKKKKSRRGRESADMPPEMPVAPAAKDAAAVAPPRLVFRESEGANNLLLFIHGFSGEAGDTFGKLPDLLMQDSRMDGWDMKPLGYSQFIAPELGKDIWAGIGDVERITDYLCTSLKYKFDKYDRIGIVAHSLGGLIAQRAILNIKEEYRSKISHLVLIGSPSNGISASKLEKLWNNKYKELSSEGEFITTLRQDWEDCFKREYPFQLKIAGSAEDEYITLESCFNAFAEEYRVLIPGRHLSMVKPEDESSDSYKLILQTLTDSEFHSEYENSEEVNIALGKYDAVKKKLLPRLDELDNNGLRSLVFALEGLGERDKALEILETNRAAQEDTDLMGIIGGRYKREYLKFPSKDAGETAFVYYELALEKSTQRKNFDQIYYHAINLAFLNLVVENNRTAMEKYAEQALHVASNCADHLWKQATVAEAHMYLGQLEESEEFYSKAAKTAGIREKISIHTNAYAGYVALTQSDNPNDEFIVFLKEHFLK